MPILSPRPRPRPRPRPPPRNHLEAHNLETLHRAARQLQHAVAHNATRPVGEAPAVAAAGPAAETPAYTANPPRLSPRRRRTPNLRPQTPPAPAPRPLTPQLHTQLSQRAPLAPRPRPRFGPPLQRRVPRPAVQSSDRALPRRRRRRCCRPRAPRHGLHLPVRIRRSRLRDG
ncbi:hypothetical protein K505DRAFT_166682 [Melanomma pulvis-pyrius CBS 109.77]|uniref:Uncharacterized protein n=1 Tax=Melanomma pulvis-pyrius CBS 109.77 TaxID=1314802 RepID=A0A6A6WPC1_9PLEO|nr:hypothetical protein K505DRAFT_166682 [Melanomma pulvis-pyrius CBS 109.77]